MLLECIEINFRHPISACLMEKGKKMQSCIETSTGMPADSELQVFDTF